jgi:hypothetical protein
MNWKKLLESVSESVNDQLRLLQQRGTASHKGVRYLPDRAISLEVSHRYRRRDDVTHAAF